MHNNSSGYISMPQSLTNLSEVHDHNTRSKSNFNYKIPLVTTNLSKTSFSYSGPKIWYEIPSGIKTGSKFAFKKQLKDFFIEKYDYQI